MGDDDCCGVGEQSRLEHLARLCSGHGYVVQSLGSQRRSQRRASLTVHGRNIISPALSSATHPAAPHDERTKAMNPGSLHQCPRNSSGFEHSLSPLAFIARSTSAKRCDSTRQPYSKRGRPVRSRPARRPQMFSEPGVGASGLSQESRRYEASASSWTEHRVSLSNSLHQSLLTPRTASVEWLHASASFGWMRRPRGQPNATQWRHPVIRC